MACFLRVSAEQRKATVQYLMTCFHHRPYNICQNGPKELRAFAVRPNQPEPNARPLSQILADIEARPDFHYFQDIEWDDDRYEIGYRTRDGNEREIYVDPMK